MRHKQIKKKNCERNPARQLGSEELKKVWPLDWMMGVPEPGRNHETQDYEHEKEMNMNKTCREK